MALKRVWDNSSSGGGNGGGDGGDNSSLLTLPAALLREPQALQTVQHANVVQLHRTFKLVTSSMPYLCAGDHQVDTARRLRDMPPSCSCTAPPSWCDCP